MLLEALATKWCLEESHQLCSSERQSSHADSSHTKLSSFSAKRTVLGHLKVSQRIGTGTVPLVLATTSRKPRAGARGRLTTPSHLSEECRPQGLSEFIRGCSTSPCWLPDKDSPCPLKTDDSGCGEQLYWLLPFTYALSFQSPQGSPALILNPTWHARCHVALGSSASDRRKCVHPQTQFRRHRTRNTECMAFSENEWITYFRHLLSPSP